MTRSEYKKNWLSKGLCGNCGSNPNSNGIYCIGCYTTRKEAAKKRRKSRLKLKLCMRCMSPDVVIGAKRCSKCLEIDANDQRNKRIRMKVNAFNAYGGPRCACCGELNSGFLTIDHINGDGNKHRKELGKTIRGNMIYTWLAKQGYPSGFQVLCFNCNCGKNSNGGVCPHKGENIRFKQISLT